MNGAARIRLAIKRTDFDGKVDGTARYCADISMPGMLYAKTLRSTLPRAKILSIDIPSLPAGYFLIDHKDISGRNIVPIVYEDEPFLAAGRVNYIGEPILLIAGPDKEVISALLRQIEVHYQPERPILTIEEAEQRGSDFIFEGRPDFVSYEYGKGDFDKAVRDADFFVEDEFRTGYQEHAYLETQSVLAVYEDSVITVFGSMQCPYMIKESLEQALNWPQERVRVVQLPTGGAFGGKEDYTSIPAVHAALAAIKSGKPVQLVFDRREDIICTTKRHPSVIRIKSYIDSNRRIIARDVDIRTDAGAYAGLSSVVLQRLSFAACGAYKVENLRVRAKAIATNNIVSGAFRGFGGPQAFFAIEMHMEHIARRLKVDSLQLKKEYFLHEGDTSSTGGRFNFPVKLEEISAAVEKASSYREKRDKYEMAAITRRTNAADDTLKGIGCSIFFHGCGFTGNGERDLLKSKVKLRKSLDGTVEVFISNTEIGQGSQTTSRKIVAETLGIPISKVICNYPDTLNCPDSGPTVASRTTMVIGKLLQDCALELKQRWGEGSFEIESSYKYPENLSWDNETLKGNAYADYAWGANVVEVSVNPLTFETRITGVWSAYDIGTPIDERIVAGQIEGGIAQGLGYGGMEVLTVKSGRILQDNLTTYVIPTSMDFPKPINELIDNPLAAGPFGARGLGELPLVGAAAAFALAVEQAIGRPVNRIPVTPEYVMELMNGGLRRDGE